MAMQHWFMLAVVLLIGYAIGARYPALAKTAGIA
jgi:hypothetical protein